MAENISGIGYTTTGAVTSSSGNSKGSQPAVEEEKKDNQPAVEQKTQYTPEQIFEMMSARAAMNAAQVHGGYDVGKYNSAEDIARIEAMMLNDFEPAVIQALLEIEEEFGDMLSEEAKLALAAKLAAA